MSSTALPPRPRQLTLAAGVVIGGSVFLVAAVFDALANLQSVETREQLQDVVSSSAGRELGVTLDQTVSAMRAALNLTAVCAVIAAVLGIFVLQRHRGARIGLSVLAVPLILTAPLAGGFLGAMVAIASLMLWGGAAGDWYAGRPIRKPSVRGRRESEVPPPASGPPPTPAPQPAPSPTPSTTPSTTPSGASTPSTLDTSTTPEATQGFGAAVDPFTPSLQEQQPAEQVSLSPGQPPVPGPAPPSVRLACLLTWVFSGMVAMLYLVALVALVIQRQAIVDRVVDSPAWRDAGLPDDSLVPMLWLGVLLFLAWSTSALVLAWFTWRRHDWARYLLTVSAGAALLVGLIAFPVGLLHQIACAATIAGLFTARARAWFAGRSTTPPGQSPPRPW